MKTLILTGWGWKCYAFAAALALRVNKGADVIGVSTRRLPEVLLEKSQYNRIIVVGEGNSYLQEHQAYKDIDEVIAHELDLIQLIVKLSPLAVVKGKLWLRIFLDYVVCIITIKLLPIQKV